MTVPGCEGLRLLLTTCEKYYPAVPVFAHQFNKYFSPLQEVVVLGFGPFPYDLPPNFRFWSCGDQADYPLKRWSNALLKALQTPLLVGDVLGIFLDDYWLTRPVDLDLVGVAFRYMKQFEYVAKFDLAHDRLHAHGADLNYGEIGYNGHQYHLVKSMPGSPYHSSLWPGLWRKQALLDYIQPDWTPWDVEIVGTFGLSHLADKYIVIGTHEGALDISLSLRGGDSGKLLLDGLPPDDVADLRARGLLAHWEGVHEGD